MAKDTKQNSSSEFPEPQNFSTRRIIDDIQVGPTDKLLFDKMVSIPYTTTQPSGSPIFSGTRNIYFDGSNYWLYVFANGSWRTQQLGVTQATSETTGVIKMYGGSSAPSGYLECDGSAVSRSTYSALFTAIGTTFGSGDGSTTFNVPSFARRVPVGKGGSGTATLSNTIGSTGGEETHTLTTPELPAHAHALTGVKGNGGGTDSPYFQGVSNSSASAVNNTDNAGSGTAHNVMQPSLVVMYIIKT